MRTNLLLKLYGRDRGAMPIAYCVVLLLLVWQPVFAQSQGAANQSIIRYDSIHHPVLATGGVVVSQNEAASEVGRQVLLEGGNAVDAAVAMGFALAVTLPRAGNLGGSGFMLVRQSDAGSPDDVVALDFRSTAPMAARSADFIDADGEVRYEELTYGARAPGVPGTVAGLEEAWKRFGSLPWEDVLSPAIELAENGIEVSGDLAYALAEALTVMANYPSSMAAYAKPDGTAYAAGETLIQSDLAWSLREIGEHGADAFYRGAVAEKIYGYMEQSGGLISAEDLANYRVRERRAIATDYRDHRVVTMPPSSVGGLALLQMLNVLGHYDMASLPQGSAASMHLLAETMKQANANRREGIGDIDFVEVPIAGILSESIAREMAASIDPDRATPVAEISPIDAYPHESRDTTHLSVVDGEGNAVSLTYTLGYSFGSGLVIPGTGIILDNQMRNFSIRDPDIHANRIEPGKRVVSTMTPTMVFDEDDQLFLVTGTPGGSRIHNVILQLIVNTVDYGMNIAEATHAPRIYQAWREPELGVERGVSADSLRLLEAMGHEIEVQQTMGSTQSIMLREGLLYGAADPRRPGAAALGID
ncbi:MAG: gamma-glutamyltransferase [Gammaproteobacteria bacterium]|nr:gamma-glutamyltransferase [Gammaproteobacteria bacterium]